MAGRSGREISIASPKTPVKRILSWEGALVLIFIAVNILGVILSENYTVANVLRQMPRYLAEIFILFPMGYILILGDIDISVGSIVCLCATTACFAGNAGFPFPVVMLVCLLTGLVCGAVNGAILAKFTELPSMIVTLGTQIIFRGIAEVAMGSGGSISYTNSIDLMVLTQMVGPFPIVFFFVLISAVIFIVLLSKTTFGRKLYAIGSNKEAAYYAGIKVQKIRFIVFSLAGLMSGFCALFLLSVLFSANTTTGNGFEMEVIAMAVFGGIATTGGKGNLVGGFIAAFIIVCLRVALGLINMNTQLILVIIGLMLIIAVLMPGISQRIKGMRKTVK
ncbi:MAG TPA: ABC transporter permease [Candidatus Mediterraneibacter vanvlietii]|nr:ABC transporter permease [Candidatus Mediterraneibacter vanvlietii]